MEQKWPEKWPEAFKLQREIELIADIDYDIYVSHLKFSQWWQRHVWDKVKTEGGTQ